ncbi:MAG TPA: DHA2 family efflux MFS transporter permease subunit [Streptosporangiaceae bacterium]|nr:DHA2 family efflux MFS transporter permease subunit [Streptosporangiaceae bacterium]
MTNTSFPSAGTAVRPRWILGLTSVAYFMVVLDSLVVVTALPRMQQDLHAGLAALQWTVNSYGIAFAAGIITAAALGDRFGRRRVFILGLALFTLASATCAMAPGVTALILARTVQGLGAAVVLPLSLTILTAAFPPQRRGLIVGVYGGLAGLAVAAGPIVGGAITQSLDWHWIFWLNVPIGLLAATLGTRLLPESHGAPQPLDLPGVALVTGGVVALVWSLVRAGDLGWSAPQTAGPLLAGCALLLGFVWWQRRAHAPLVPLGLFRSRAFAAGTVTTFLMSGATFAAAFLITQEFQFARYYSPVSAGLRLLPFFATPMVVSPFAGALSDRIGRRPIMVTGLALQALGFAWVAARGSLRTSWVELVVALLVAGVGISMALPTVPTAVLNAVPATQLGTASGINYMAQRLGTVFAIAIASAVFAARGHLGNPAAVTAGFRPALWSAVAFAVLAAATALTIPAPPRRTPAPRATTPADAPVAA